MSPSGLQSRRVLFCEFSACSNFRELSLRGKTALMAASTRPIALSRDFRFGSTPEGISFILLSLLRCNLQATLGEKTGAPTAGSVERLCGATRRKREKRSLAALDALGLLIPRQPHVG